MPASAVSDRTQANDFARKFRLVLEALNWSRTRCARELGVDKSVISRWASGVAQPTEHNLTRLTAIIQRARPRFQPRAWRLDPTPFAALLKAEVRPASPASPAGSRGQPSIAVLPFEDRSAEPENDHFARGMAEDIITELSRSRTLLVISRGSSFSYQGRDVDRQQIGCELGVRYLLEGSVRRAGTRLRVTAQLIEAETGVHVWSERYDLALDPIPESTSGRVVLTLCRARYRVGFLTGSQWAPLTHAVTTPDGDMHQALLPVFLFSQLVGKPNDPSGLQLTLCLRPEEIASGRAAVSQVIGPFARRRTSPRSPASRAFGFFAHATGLKVIDRAWWHAFWEAFLELDKHFASCLAFKSVI